MSNKTRLQANNETIQNLINKANSLPDAGSGGGGGVETCTVITQSNVRHPVIYLTTQNQEQIVTYSDDYNDPKTINNVVCGSNIFIPVASTIPAYSINGNAHYVDELGGYSIHRTIVFKITASQGETVTINCWDDD